MEIISTAIPDVKIIVPKVFSDHRGSFFESFHKENLRIAGIEEEFVQDNQSCSGKHILRGLHFQLPPHAQGKLVRVIKGSVRDVAVDLRKSSPHYGKHVIIDLTASNQWLCWIPAGFAHGFLSLEAETIFHYKCTRYYHPASERTLRWDDPNLAISWDITHPILSDKDLSGELFKNFNNPF